MSELNPPEDWQLAAPCPYCGAEPGEPCADARGCLGAVEDEDLNDSNDWESTP
jgi:hypothetical protein